MRLFPLARPFLIAWLLAGLWMGAAVERASAQTPDSTETTPADSLRPPPADSLGRPALDSLAANTLGTADSLRTVRPPVGYARFTGGAVVGDSLPATRPALDATELLADIPSSFVYRFGSPGWPDAWSPYGLNPQRVALILNGRPFADPVTGRPRYDLLPLAFMERPRVEAGHYGAPVAVGTEVRPYVAPQPLTELRYLAGATIQSVDAIHVQERRRSLFGRPGVLNVLAAYSGRGADGEYAERGFGTSLKKVRQTYGRLRYEQAAWSVEISNLHNRRKVGAFGGVEPVIGPNIPFESIYSRVSAPLRDAEARRQTLRNDLALTVRTRLVPGLDAPLTTSAYWTAQTFRYLASADTLETKTNRYGFLVQQSVTLGAHGITVQLEGWQDHLRATNALAAPRRYDHALHASVRDTARWRGTRLALEGGVHSEPGRFFPAASARLEQQLGPLRFFASGAYAGQPVSPVERYGYGDYVAAASAMPDGRIAWAEAGTSVRGGPFDLALSAFAHRTSEALDLYVQSGEADSLGALSYPVTDTVQALVSSVPHERAGLTAQGGWRRNAQRGFYLTAQATLNRFLNPDVSPEHTRVANSLPELFGQARFGARYAPFRGDLDFDLYVLTRFWTATRSRTLHPQTGLLALPPIDARVFGPSNTLDVYFETRFRDASVFLAFENALSGTTLVPGNLIVPVYPLPRRRFRFGVFWPISG
ncbi:MAG: putative porin [Rhodothermales bacterium]